MSINIQHIAKLARLRIEDDQLAKFEHDMESIVAMVDKLPDVSDALTLDASRPMQLREDVAVTDKFSRDELLKNAPQVQAGCVVVPKTVE
jgi:aspartyl-tRNA(Asn)/glutamyl-tRNA(Gln) amidotransferase subunit C